MTHSSLGSAAANSTVRATAAKALDAINIDNGLDVVDLFRWMSPSRTYTGRSWSARGRQWFQGLADVGVLVRVEG